MLKLIATAPHVPENDYYINRLQNSANRTHWPNVGLMWDTLVEVKSDEWKIALQRVKG